MADQKYFKITNSSKKRKTTLAYEYMLKNNNSFPVQFKLVDQFPISQTKSAEVKIEKTSNGNINKETGEITWLMDLKPGQSIKKELVFTIEMDANYSYYKRGGRKKFRTMSCPSF